MLWKQRNSAAFVLFSLLAWEEREGERQQEGLTELHGSCISVHAFTTEREFKGAVLGGKLADSWHAKGSS